MTSLKIKKYKSKRAEPRNRYFLQLEDLEGQSYTPTYNQLFKAPGGMFAAKVDPQDAPWTEFIIISGSLPDDKIINTHENFSLMRGDLENLEENEEGILHG